MTEALRTVLLLGCMALGGNATEANFDEGYAATQDVWGSCGDMYAVGYIRENGESYEPAYNAYDGALAYGCDTDAHCNLLYGEEY